MCVRIQSAGDLFRLVISPVSPRSSGIFSLVKIISQDSISCASLWRLDNVYGWELDRGLRIE